MLLIEKIINFIEKIINFITTITILTVACINIACIKTGTGFLQVTGWFNVFIAGLFLYWAIVKIINEQKV